jgi:hypothetical protein
LGNSYTWATALISATVKNKRSLSLLVV